jgi:hypothetical protein
MDEGSHDGPVEDDIVQFVEGEEEVDDNGLAGLMKSRPGSGIGLRGVSVVVPSDRIEARQERRSRLEGHAHIDVDVNSASGLGVVGERQCTTEGMQNTCGVQCGIDLDDDLADRPH